MKKKKKGQIKAPKGMPEFLESSMLENILFVDCFSP